MCRRQSPSQGLAALGFMGAIIGANTVYKEYEDKEFLYNAASVIIWLFGIIPAVTDIWRQAQIYGGCRLYNKE